MRGLTLLLVVACHDDDACAGFDPRELAACRQCGPIPRTAGCGFPCPTRLPPEQWCEYLHGPANCCDCEMSVNGSAWFNTVVDCFPPRDAQADAFDAEPSDAGGD